MRESVSTVGEMVDVVKNNPVISYDDYLWRINPCLLKLMSFDNTRVHYLSEKEKKMKNSQIIDGSNLLKNDLGMRIF